MLYPYYVLLWGTFGCKIRPPTWVLLLAHFLPSIDVHDGAISTGMASSIPRTCFRDYISLHVVYYMIVASAHTSE